MLKREGKLSYLLGLIVSIIGVIAAIISMLFISKRLFLIRTEMAISLVSLVCGLQITRTWTMEY